MGTSIFIKSKELRSTGLRFSDCFEKPEEQCPKFKPRSQRQTIAELDDVWFQQGFAVPIAALPKSRVSSSVMSEVQLTLAQESHLLTAVNPLPTDVWQ